MLRSSHPVAGDDVAQRDHEKAERDRHHHQVEHWDFLLQAAHRSMRVRGPGSIKTKATRDSPSE